MRRLRALSDYMIISGCAFLSSLVYQIFILENSFAPNGLNGIATMVQHIFDFKIGYMSLLINIPMLVLAYFKLNKAFALRSGTFVVIFSVAMLLLEQVDLSAFVYKTANGTSTILAPVAAGVVAGFTNGLTIKKSGCTGGTDIIAALIRKRRPYINLVTAIFILNTIVACLSFFVYDYQFEPVILCILYGFLVSTVSNAILKGGKAAIKFEVVTDQAEELSKRLIKELHHSVTSLPATGMYSHTGKQVILCIINKHQIVSFQNILREFPGSFAYISDVRETVGNFKSIAPAPIDVPIDN